MIPRHVLAATALAALLGTSAYAEGMAHSGHDMSAMSGKGAMPALMGTMDHMMTAMDGMESTGNPDADFLLMMIPHHQSALDMAQVELAQGKDEETIALAKTIIAAQEKEIAEMKAMLTRMGVEAPE